MRVSQFLLINKWLTETEITHLHKYSDSWQWLWPPSLFQVGTPGFKGFLPFISAGPLKLCWTEWELFSHLPREVQSGSHLGIQWDNSSRSFTDLSRSHSCWLSQVIIIWEWGSLLQFEILRAHESCTLFRDPYNLRSLLVSAFEKHCHNMKLLSPCISV